MSSAGAYRPNPATAYTTQVRDGIIIVRGVRRTKFNNADDVTVQAMDFGPDVRDHLVDEALRQVDNALDAMAAVKLMSKNEEVHGTD